MPIIEESEYKGNPMIVIKRAAEDRYPFQFGLSKAKLIMESLEDIKKFVKKHDPEYDPENIPEPAEE